ncbi:YcxB family protein [Candidatus Heimdallarchaeota archaeon]|nr:MAG: YcxB family protein [Candidatus Heimdallarchaeota archaeon]
MINLEHEEMILEYPFDPKTSERVYNEIDQSQILKIISFVMPIFILVIVEAFFLFLAYLNNFSLSDIITLIITPVLFLLAVILPYFFKKSIKRHLRTLTEQKSSFQGSNCKIVINTDGVYATLPNIEHRLKWNYITKVVARKEFIYFYLINSTFSIRATSLTIPKKALTDEQQFQLYQLLVQHLGKGKVDGFSFQKELIEGEDNE